MSASLPSAGGQHVERVTVTVNIVSGNKGDLYAYLN